MMSVLRILGTQLKLSFRLVWLAVLMTATGFSQQALQDPELVRRLLDKVNQLEARVKELESHETKPAQTTAAAKVFESQASAGDHHGEPATDSSAFDAPHLSLRGYADVGYSVKHAGQTANSFGLGQLDLFITSRLSSRLGVLVEAALDANALNQQRVSVERLLLQYRQNQYFNFDVGRYHSAIGYWNTTYHHGTWFQTSLSRPFLFTGESSGGLLPIHNVGVSVSGGVPSGSLAMRYAVEIGNGRAYRTSQNSFVQTVTDENNGKSVNLALWVQPERWPGLRLGGSVYRDTLTPDSVVPIRQYIFNAHVVYAKSRIEALNEVIWMRHTRMPVQSRPIQTSVPAFYSQLGYRFGALRPYFRYEWMNAGASDPIARPALGASGWRRVASGGIRYDFAEFAAFKIQFDRLSRRDLQASHQAAVQFAFTF